MMQDYYQGWNIIPFQRWSVGTRRNVGLDVNPQEGADGIAHDEAECCNAEA